MTSTINSISEILESIKLSDYFIDSVNIKKFQKHLQKYQQAIKLKLDSGVTTDLEEHCKKLFNDFLNDVYSYDINTHDRIDSVIRDENNDIQVMIEVKSPNNDKEMINAERFNNKALHELLLYYYEQRQELGSTINNLIITDCKSIYFFNSTEFQKLIDNKKIEKLLSGYKNKELSLIKNNPDFYKEISKLLESEFIEISACKINLFDEEMNFENVYRLFDKHSLFKKALENDANELNREFYQELLHIMGLQEKYNKLVKSTIKNTLLDLTEQKINKRDSFETALGLNILWLNRILFLKILESQLKVFRNDRNFMILDPEKITGYHLLSKLFFSILSTPRTQRHEDDKKYDTIPYLNSSLFEETELERLYRISDLDIERILKIKSDSVLYKDKTFKKTELTLLEYMLRFLNCFSYNSDSDSVDKNTLIKSSVLGTVFERLNGYKDGSYFTPASITMYMSEKVLQKRIIDIFNKEFTLEFEDYTELSTHVFRNYSSGTDRQKAQALVDNMTILDPAVGSGHFLVSSLNELIKIKSQLGLLHKDIKVTIDNDELIIKSSFGDNFVYERIEGKISVERKEIQKAIFDAKKHIIDNQLYGVDINPNSVNICRLRLWIELLKHTYYTDDKYIDLEVLPNLEFKVMTANSLISIKDIQLFFKAIDRVELSKLMHTYYNAILSEKEQIKNKVQELINNVKSHIEELKNYDPFNTIVSCRFFDSGLMFGIEGFDIVIGNPPYVSNKGISSTMMSEYKAEYGIQDDLYNYFYLRGFEFLKDNGILGYITSNTFLTLQSKQKLRQFLQSKQLLEMRLVDNLFEHAEVEPIIVIACNSDTAGDKKEMILISTNYQFNYVDNRNQAILYEGNNILIDINTYREAPNQVFFTPNKYNMMIRDRLLGAVQSNLISYWDAIKTSSAIEKNKTELDRDCRNKLRAGDIALLGLLTDGGQGLATANNGFYIGVRENTKDADRTYRQRIEKIAKFNKEYDTNYDITKMTELEIRKLFTELKEKHGRDVFGQGFLYQIVHTDEIADVNTLKQDEKDSGIKGKRSFVPYDKGDKDGNRWYMPTVYAINWSKENVNILKKDTKARWQGYNFFLKEGFCWNDINGDKNTNNLKVKTSSCGIYDVKSMKLCSQYQQCSDKYMLVVLNSNFINRYTEAFINFTISFQINDMRQIPIIIPTLEQLTQAELLFDKAKAIKEDQIIQKITKQQADTLLNDIQIEVDDFVYALYGLTAAEVAIAGNN